MIFASVDDALRWAYAFDGREVIARSRVFTSGKLAPRCPPIWEAWTIWERHAQAAQLRKQAESLGDPVSALAIACYAPLDQRWPAVVTLAAYLAPNCSGETARAYRMIVEQYAVALMDLRAGGIGPVRRALACRKLSALNERRRLFDALDAIRLRLFETLRPGLTRGGLLSSSSLLPGSIETPELPRRQGAGEVETLR